MLKLHDNIFQHLSTFLTPTETTKLVRTCHTIHNNHSDLLQLSLRSSLLNKLKKKGLVLEDLWNSEERIFLKISYYENYTPHIYCNYDNLHKFIRYIYNRGFRFSCHCNYDDPTGFIHIHVYTSACKYFKYIRGKVSILVWMDEDLFNNYFHNIWKFDGNKFIAE